MNHGKNLYSKMDKWRHARDEVYRLRDLLLMAECHEKQKRAEWDEARTEASNTTSLPDLIVGPSEFALVRAPHGDRGLYLVIERDRIEAVKC